MKYLLGLTGSIGMGKSTTAQMFRDNGIPVWDADAAVHRVYGKGGAAVGPVGKEFPSAIKGGAVSSETLRQIIANDRTVLDRLEAIVHPILVTDREQFIADNDGPLVFDIPLLFETGADSWLDAVVVVSASLEEQTARVLGRPGMDQSQFDLILSRQLPDAEKRARADYIIETHTLDGARQSVRDLIASIKGQMADA